MSEHDLTIAISSRALFDFEEENRFFEASDPMTYRRFQLERLDVPARPGVAFPLVKKLLAFNAADRRPVNVVIVSRNDPVSGLRVFRSGEHAGIELRRGVFTGGREPYRFLGPLGAHLFLSAHAEDVKGAIGAGFPAARVYPESVFDAQRHPGEIRIAFDGDAVLFSDEAERVFVQGGLQAFEAHEKEKALQPLPPGPLEGLLRALCRLKATSCVGVPKVRIALVTARSAPAHERAVRTLVSWDVQIDEALFLGGMDKGPFLREFAPDFFFDDQIRHCESARGACPVGHVIDGVKNA